MMSIDVYFLCLLYSFYIRLNIGFSIKAFIHDSFESMFYDEYNWMNMFVYSRHRLTIVNIIIPPVPIGQIQSFHSEL